MRAPCRRLRALVGACQTHFAHGLDAIIKDQNVLCFFQMFLFYPDAKPGAAVDEIGRPTDTPDESLPLG
jgi:hypothetical protein